MEKFLIKNAKIITQNSIVDGDLYIEDGRIGAFGSKDAVADAVGGNCREVSAVETLDAGGLYLSPGFIDLHNHGRLGANVMDATDAALDTIAEGQLAHGVTGFLAGTSSATNEQLLGAVRQVAAYCGRHRDAVSQCLGLYLESNFFSAEKRGAHSPELLRLLTDEELASLLEAGGAALKIFALSPELTGALPAIRRLRKEGIVVAAAHTNATFDEAMAGINAGITLSTHTFNGMRAFVHHDPGVVGAILDDDRVVCEAIADGIHLEPAVLRLLLRVKGPDRIALISDSVAFNGLPNGNYPHRGQTVTVTDGAIRMEDGRLAGSCLSLNIAVRNMVRLAGATLPEAVRMAALTPARVLGLDAAKGSIAVGKDADLVLFDNDINIKQVFIGGQKIENNHV